MLLPARTPPAIVKTYNDALNQVLADPAVLQKFKASNLVATPGKPDVLDRQIREDAAMWKKVITEQDIKPE
jgi:tripartite-type tricarboxylate transporter receptor subunit TctC